MEIQLPSNVGPKRQLVNSLKTSIFEIDALKGDPVDASRSWRDSDCPKLHRGATLDRHTASGQWGEAYKKLKSRLHLGPLIVLLGRRGTGKTQLAVDLLADLAWCGKPVKYFTAMDLFRELRACNKPGGLDELQTVKKLTSYFGLVVDEAQERGESDWENRTLTNLVDKRYGAMRATILISNLTKESFAEAIGASAISRINECGQVVVCDWPSFRGMPVAGNAGPVGDVSG